MNDKKKSATALDEEKVIETWVEEKTFEKSVANREGQPRFVFNDGPPFANGQPHFGHSLVTGIKDGLLRYKTMRGNYVPRRNGWDCHGLPVEFAIEKDFNVSGKKQILELGLEKFNAACRDSIFKYKADWETFLTRYGRWSDYEHHYATVDRDYTESVWWILSEINKKGLLYKGLKSVPYCPRCATPLSNFELNEGYQDNISDPSVFALFPLKDDPAVSFLAWTTTPWTLPANAALAVDPKAQYAYVKLTEDGSTLILAKERLDVLDLRNNQYKLLKTAKGSQLVGLRYEPLYPLKNAKFNQGSAKNAHQVFADASVSLEDGTGILHVAPRYGEADLALGLKENLPLIESVDSSGHMVSELTSVAGQFFKKADEIIIAELTRSGRIFAAETANHTYPFCWRCDTPLMYYATITWFVEVSKVRGQMLKTAADINWVPANIKEGRFGKWLEGARDWAISRNRYWGAPLPIWVNTKDENDYIVVGSIEELKELAGPDIKVDDLHRPFIDEISFTKDGKTYKRVDEVLDCWFESGSMPVAQYHYPFENKQLFEANFPADFITEGLDQTRLWFYVQHVISTILFNKPAFKNVIVTGMIMAADGQKLSKRLRNYPPTDDVFEKEGADAWRLYLLSSTQATETADYMRFDRSGMTDVARNVLGTLNNSVRFFTTYSVLDKWEAPKTLEEPSSSNLLDQWILARTNQTIGLATRSADNYKIAHAILPVFDLVDDMSNWYIRRSRKRFWKSENDQDKQQAYATLHYTLVSICQLMAPWAPFISDSIWRELVQGTDLPKSVHLSDWPSVSKPDSTSLKLLEDMKTVRELVVNEGLSQRAAAGIKVRQPLASATVNIIYNTDLDEIIAEELNVKEVKRTNKPINLVVPKVNRYKVNKPVTLDTKITPALKSEGIMRELVRIIQNARKNAGLNVEDRINLRLEVRYKLITDAILRHKSDIFAETLATGELEGEGGYSEVVKVEGKEVKISLSKA
ncbi:MAG: isoleucine--tRNA ligase [Patescibacteria group bacterium]